MNNSLKEHLHEGNFNECVAKNMELPFRGPARYFEVEHYLSDGI